MLAALVAVFNVLVTAQDVSVRDRFGLYNECRSMGLVVEPLTPEAAGIDITEERIQTLAESRVRAARLYDAEVINFLYVRVVVGGPAFSREVSYYKRLYDPVSNEHSLAQTWSTSYFGTHGGDAGFILQHLSEDLDRFILEYLRVNDEDCER